MVRSRQEMIQELSREPTLEELAERCQMPVARVGHLLNLKVDAISLDQTLGSDTESDMTLLDLIEDSEATSDYSDLENLAVRGALANAMAALTEKEREVIRMKFGLGGSQRAASDEEIAASLGISRERVRQLEYRAKLRLRVADSSGALKELLEP